MRYVTVMILKVSHVAVREQSKIKHVAGFVR